MDLEVMLREIDKLGWGLATMNTYSQDDILCVFILFTNTKRNLSVKVEGKIIYWTKLLCEAKDKIYELSEEK